MRFRWGSHATCSGKEGLVGCGREVGMRGLINRLRSVGLSWHSTDSHSIGLAALRNMFESVVDHLEDYDTTKKEEHEVFITTLNHLHYFSYHARENIVSIWQGKIFLV